jgi:hypothetical protein
MQTHKVITFKEFIEAKDIRRCIHCVSLHQIEIVSQAMAEVDQLMRHGEYANPTKIWIRFGNKACLTNAGETYSIDHFSSTLDTYDKACEIYDFEEIRFNIKPELPLLPLAVRAPLQKFVLAAYKISSAMPRFACFFEHGSECGPSFAVYGQISTSLGDLSCPTPLATLQLKVDPKLLSRITYERTYTLEELLELDCGRIPLACSDDGWDL